MECALAAGVSQMKKVKSKAKEMVDFRLLTNITGGLDAVYP